MPQAPSSPGRVPASASRVAAAATRAATFVALASAALLGSPCLGIAAQPAAPATLLVGFDDSVETGVATAFANRSWTPEEADLAALLDRLGVESVEPLFRTVEEQRALSRVAAPADNGEGIVGVAWRARVMPVRAGFVVLQPQSGTPVGLLEADDVAAAVVWTAEAGADVLNLSFGTDQISNAVAMALEHARGLAALAVAAAGNGRSEDLQFPAPSGRGTSRSSSRCSTAARSTGTSGCSSAPSPTSTTPSP